MQLHWSTEPSIPGEDPPTDPVSAWEKVFEVAGAGPSKLCHVVLRSGVLIGRPEHGKRPFLKDPLSDWLNRPPQIHGLRVHSFPFSVANYVSSVNVLPRRRSSPCTLCGNDVADVRSDKDGEPETYGEGIKKEIQYRRTLLLKDHHFVNSSPSLGPR